MIGGRFFLSVLTALMPATALAETLTAGEAAQHAGQTETVIWGEDRAKFGGPERLEGKHVCITGMIRMYRGAPEIVLHDPTQLQSQ